MGALGNFLFLLRDQIMVTQFVHRLAPMFLIGNPNCAVQIPETSSTLFYVGFLQTNDVAKLCVPFGALSKNGVHEIAFFAAIAFKSGRKTVVDRRAAGE